jgi:hypothetical protein
MSDDGLFDPGLWRSYVGEGLSLGVCPLILAAFEWPIKRRASSISSFDGSLLGSVVRKGKVSSLRGVGDEDPLPDIVLKGWPDMKSVTGY